MEDRKWLNCCPFEYVSHIRGVRTTVTRMLHGTELVKGKRSTPAGLEPTRDKPNRFLVDRLNRSATVSSRVSPGLSKYKKCNN